MEYEAYSLCVKFNGGADCPFTREELPKPRRQARSYARHLVCQLLQNKTKNLIIQKQQKNLKSNTNPWEPSNQSNYTESQKRQWRLTTAHACTSNRFFTVQINKEIYRPCIVCVGRERCRERERGVWGKPQGGRIVGLILSFVCEVVLAEVEV